MMAKKAMKKERIDEEKMDSRIECPCGAEIKKVILPQVVINL